MTAFCPGWAPCCTTKTCNIPSAPALLLLVSEHIPISFVCRTVLLEFALASRFCFYHLRWTQDQDLYCLIGTNRAQPFANMDPTMRAGLSPRHVTPPLYFPPPPLSASLAANAKKKGTKVIINEVREMKLEKPPKPILKHRLASTKRQRQWMLLALLVLSFAILILSVIFAYCAALPHSDNIQAAQAASSSSPTTTSTVTLVSSTSSANLSPTAKAYLIRDVPNQDQVQSKVEDALAEDQANTIRFTRSAALASLTFYTAFIPLLTMLHTSTELLTSLVRPETSQSTKLGDALRFRRPGSTEDTNKVLLRRRTGTLLSFSAAVLLLLGWTTIQFFWLNCEIVSFGRRGQDVCPVQIRGHRMGGVSELSVGKVVLAFAVMLGYGCYCFYLVRRVGVLKKVPVAGGRTASFRRRARFASGSTMQRDDGDDVESVVIGIEVEKEDSSRR